MDAVIVNNNGKMQILVVFDGIREFGDNAEKYYLVFVLSGTNCSIGFVLVISKIKVYVDMLILSFACSTVVCPLVVWSVYLVMDPVFYVSENLTGFVCNGNICATLFYYRCRISNEMTTVLTDFCPVCSFLACIQ
jgi:hypothetical protein